MKNIDLVRKHRGDILSIASRYGVLNVRVFGSTVRGEDTNESDIDFLVEFEKGKSLFDLIGFQISLEDLLGKDIDVVTRNSVHPLLKERIIGESIEL